MFGESRLESLFGGLLACLASYESKLVESASWFVELYHVCLHFGISHFLIDFNISNVFITQAASECSPIEWQARFSSRLRIGFP